ncbi:hypothetical protein ANN_19875 [Periplaneta americana]|uniref:Uncharacterized protein n=1 Tax=Periplaneta americana TaxID=6978 RepID=A0ABQ8SB37_PERAM|nr:hypothetical protein ANN_19875 [Periplaneta americana]
MDVCLDHVGPTRWEKKQETSKEKVVGRFPERVWSAVDENSEGQAGMDKTGRNYEHFIIPAQTALNERARSFGAGELCSPLTESERKIRQNDIDLL